MELGEIIFNDRPTYSDRIRIVEIETDRKQQRLAMILYFIPGQMLLVERIVPKKYGLEKKRRIILMFDAIRNRISAASLVHLLSTDTNNLNTIKHEIDRNYLSDRNIRIKWINQTVRRLTDLTYSDYFDLNDPSVRKDFDLYLYRINPRRTKYIEYENFRHVIDGYTSSVIENMY